MSDEGFLDVAAHREEPDMEIRVQTLMGTTIFVRVSPAETVADIKKKIYRLEGIPIYQQNIIFKSNELKDTSYLRDVGIRNGSVLTLVTAMRGGPISTKRLSVTCEHHVMLKELKELLENTKEEITPGSKVSVLVFKEGDVINLLRVIENEDGSYSPYSENPISPPFKPTRRDNRMGILERQSEDQEMTSKITNLRKKMEEMSLKKQGKKTVSSDFDLEPLPQLPSSSKNSSVSYKLLSQCGNDSMDSIDAKIIEKNSEDENEEEIALKDKHRSKLFRLPPTKSKSYYSESKGTYSHTKQSYARIHKKAQDLDESNGQEEKPTELNNSVSVLNKDECSKLRTMTSNNRIHLTRLVISETTDRPKSSTDSIELEENVQDLWEIHEPASERLKHSATCKVGMMKRRTSHDFGFEGRNDATKGELGNYACQNSNFEVYSRNFYHMSHLVSSPSQEEELCDYYFTKPSRSPLYGRTNSENLLKEEAKTSKIKDDSCGFLTDYPDIQPLKNKSLKCDNLFSMHDQNIDDLYGYYNIDCAELTQELMAKSEKVSELPPVIKKKSRCSECNRRLNITNMYNCRCGRLFCSQHRYSEVHGCTYDYKLEGRKMLEKQNPLVAAEKITKI